MFRILLLLFVFWAGLASAVEPDEVMSNNRLEERARMISQGLRCLQCRNESIDESNAAIAKDLRILVRERLAEGDSNKEVMNFIISRYGEYVSLQPNIQGINLILWLFGPILFLIGFFTLFLFKKKSQVTIMSSALTDLEEQKVNKLM
ncbi:MAG: cytochrome c-type biogenesis protein CcmH [Planktomarina sp.]|nr:cytochrome c-type biogenesis protein CcmH [Planktomarina sp.]